MKAVIHIKTDPEIKKNAQILAHQLGLSLSDVMNAALRNFIRDREVIFSDIPKMTPEFEKKLEKIEDDIKHGRNLSPVFKTAKEFTAYLNSK